MTSELNERIDLNQVLSHPWVKGPVASDREIQAFMQKAQVAVKIDCFSRYTTILPTSLLAREVSSLVTHKTVRVQVQ